MGIVRDLSIGAALTATLAALALRTLPGMSLTPALRLPVVDAPPPLAGPAAAPAAAALPRVPEAPAEPPLRDRNGRIIDLQGQDVAGYLAQRAGAARTGDARAAYEIYQATSLCATAGAALPDFEMPAERAEAEAERSRVRTLCAGVSAAQVQERLAFLARAAQAGDRDARIDFFTEGPQGHAAGFDPDMAAGDPQVDAWKEQALAFLQQAGAQCDPFALALLGNAYELGRLVPRDPRMALAYAIAEGAARRLPPSIVQLRERFAALLAPDDFAAALLAGAAPTGVACPADS